MSGTNMELVRLSDAEVAAVGVRMQTTFSEAAYRKYVTDKGYDVWSLRRTRDGIPVCLCSVKRDTKTMQHVVLHRNGQPPAALLNEIRRQCELHGLIFDYRYDVSL